ncbi:MAG TPA: PAS domain-containing protein [Vicinamibacterales bacterium]|nr:PAS domain-containing protein [Vicinamibacterales bacterium]
MTDRPTLEETIALLEATLEATHDGILVLDLDRRVIRYNRLLAKMLRIPTEAIDAGHAEQLLRGIAAELEDPESFERRSQELWSDVSATSTDVLRFKDGRVFERFVAPHRIGATIVGRVVSLRDIGPALRAEEALEQHRAFLEKAQEIGHIGSWVAELDGSDRLGWSSESHRIFGVPLGQFTGTSEAFFAVVHPDDRQAVRAAAEAAAAGRQPYDIEHRVVRPDGTERWVHERAAILRDPQGRALRMVGTVQDITERRQLEDQLRQSQKMEAIGRLAGGIAHDLNNALTAIAGYAELALGEVGSDHAARADVEEIRRAAERAGSVTRQLLAFSRKQLLEPRVFDLNETIAAIARLLARLLGADVEVQTRLAGAMLPVLGDPGQVEQAVINLAVNARDAMPRGGKLVLSTALETVDEPFTRSHLPMTPGQYVVLRVSDTGHGMPRETMGRIFEPFFTTKDVGKGTGLGLSMVYGTLKQIGGFIFVDSEINRGTTFRLYFPPAAAPVPAARDAPGRSSERHGHETLLIVEDEPSVRNLVASALRHDGYRLLLASSAEEALLAADAHDGPIDLLLTDAMMPGKSGVELANLLTARRPGIPVIIMSGYTEETLEVRGLKDPIVLLQKPFTPRELRRRLREVLDR